MIRYDTMTLRKDGQVGDFAISTIVLEGVHNEDIPTPYDEGVVSVHRTDNYMYRRLDGIYWYLSAFEGGSIAFNGKRYWSGRASELGKELGVPLIDVSLNRMAGYAIHIETARDLLNDKFKHIGSVELWIAQDVKTGSWNVMWRVS